MKEIQEIIRGFFEQNRELRIGNEEKKQMTQIIEDILYAYNEYTKGKRDDIEKKIRILETYVNSITEDYVRNILEKRLFLCKGRFSRWDVNKVKAEYSYKDKCFLNVQIEKYGSPCFQLPDSVSVYVNGADAGLCLRVNKFVLVH